MKKITAIILSILCLFSIFAVSASADVIDDLSGIVSDIGGDEDPLLYCVVYKKEMLSDVKVMYFPGPGVSFDGPGTVKVTNDTPIAISHDFVCWKDKNGKLYYPGDDFYVDGECELYPVWEEKKDNDPYVLRVIKAALATFVRMFQKALGIFEIIDDFNKDYYATMTDPTNETEDLLEDLLGETEATSQTTTTEALAEQVA